MKMYGVRLLASALTSVAALASAGAADMYRPPEGVSMKDAPVYSPIWTGFYAGINGGYGWSAEDSRLGAAAERTFCPKEFCEVPDVIVDAKSRGFATSGGFGGGQIGYNWQPVSGGYKDSPAVSHLVFGIEADIQGAGIDGSGSVSLLGGLASAKGTNDLDWFGTVRGRIGYAMDATLFYFTGGVAFGGVKDTLSLTPVVGATSTVSKSETETGYVVGGGIEHLFSPRWSGKIEYQYIDLGDDKLATIAGSPGFLAAAALDAEHKYHTIRLGLNYHFDRGYEPLK